jgi:hypothetical protein
LPQTVFASYDEVWKRIEKQVSEKRDRAKKVLSWISFASRPLTIEEVRQALAVSPEDKELILDARPALGSLASACMGLVIIDQESKVVRLVHETTQAYFRDKRQIYFPHAQQNIAETCLTYLSFATFEKVPNKETADLELYTKKHAFLDYAARHWTSHFRQAKNTQAVLSAACNVFDTRSGKFHTWFQIYWTTIEKSVRNMPNLTGLMAASCCGLEDVVRMLVKNGADVNTKGKDGWTALHWASKYGRIAVAEELLGGGADCKAQDDDGRTALHLAVDYMQEDVLQLLAGHQEGMCLEIRDVLGLTALHFAVRISEWRGDEGEMTVKLLLQKGARHDVRSFSGTTAVVEAASYQRGSVAQLLKHLIAHPETHTGQRLIPDKYDQPDRNDLEAMWKFLKAGMSKVMWDLEKGIDMKLVRHYSEDTCSLLDTADALQYMGLYT